MPISAEKNEELQKAFKKSDKSGDGRLSFEEMKRLLKRGNPDLGDNELQLLFQGVDKNHDGGVDFSEFVAYIYQDAPEAPEGVTQCFNAFAGKGGELDGREFMKMLKESGLFDKKFAQNDVDMIFTKKLRGTKKRTVTVDKFTELLEEVALKKGCAIEDVFAKIASMEGPHLQCTQADAVRLNDDKSTFTGAHATGGKHGDAGSHAVRTHDQAGPELDTATDLSETQVKFAAFAGKDGTLDQKELCKMMKDCGIVDSRFNTNNCDLIFTKVCPKGQRKIQFAQFMDAIRHIAVQKGQTCEDLRTKIMASAGPVLHGTQADAVRLNDDKSTFTGAHATGGKHGDAGTHAVRAHDQAGPELDTTTDLSETQVKFAAFAGKDGTLDQKELSKMMKDCGIVDSKFNTNSCDLVFTKICPKGQRKIQFAQFMDAIRNIAMQKGETCEDLRTKIMACTGPILHGTQADAVRLNDDKSTYTGAHATGGKHGNVHA
jgi:Ca2+-binding EF-hand superfamily protein